MWLDDVMLNNKYSDSGLGCVYQTRSVHNEKKKIVGTLIVIPIAMMDVSTTKVELTKLTEDSVSINITYGSFNLDNYVNRLFNLRGYTVGENGDLDSEKLKFVWNATWDNYDFKNCKKVYGGGLFMIYVPYVKKIEKNQSIVI